jgi:hypothetical protein
VKLSSTFQLGGPVAPAATPINDNVPINIAIANDKKAERTTGRRHWETKCQPLVGLPTFTPSLVDDASCVTLDTDLHDIDVFESAHS